MTKATVTVDLADLETLVFATAAIKAIEGALAGRKNDPFVKKHLDYTAANDRLATAMRNATRPEAYPEWDEALTSEEYLALRRVEKADQGVLAIGFRSKRDYFDGLSSKGCVIIGTAIDGYVWAGEN